MAFEIVSRIRPVLLTGMAALSLVAMGSAADSPALAAPKKGPPVDVTRFHLGTAITPGSTILQQQPPPAVPQPASAPATGPAPGSAGPSSLEFGLYAGAVEGALARLGFGAPATPVTAEYIAIVGLTRETREGPPRSSGLSIGLGGGGFFGGRGGGVGVGGGFNVPVGRPRATYVTITEMTVQIRRRADEQVLWEGRAQTTERVGKQSADARVTAARLADALFRGFPGESGRTIRVK